MVIVLDDEVPMTWNRLYSGKHWTIRKAEADRVHLIIRSQLDPDQLVCYEQPVRITITYHRSDGRTVKDPCNIMAKLYIDGLVHAGILNDDTFEHVASVTTVISPSQTPSTVIQIEPL